MRRSWSLLWLLVACATCAGQAAPADLADVAVHAAIIFRGHVVAVVCEPVAAPDEVAAHRISFVIDDGIRGVKTGETLTIREWNSGTDDYRVGESLVLFLHTPSALGFTSPVGGSAGHRRPDEIPEQVLEGFRAPVVENIKGPVVPRAVPPRRSKKLPTRAVREREEHE